MNYKTSVIEQMWTTPFRANQIQLSLFLPLSPSFSFFLSLLLSQWFSYFLFGSIHLTKLSSLFSQHRTLYWQASAVVNVCFLCVYAFRDTMTCFSTHFSLCTNCPLTHPLTCLRPRPWGHSQALGTQPGLGDTARPWALGTQLGPGPWGHSQAMGPGDTARPWGQLGELRARSLL